MQSYQKPINQVAYAAPGSGSRAPYAAPGSQQASSGGGGGTANFKKPAFLLKIVSVFFGLIGMSVALHGYFNGLWYHQTLNVFLCNITETSCKLDDHSLEKICHEFVNEKLKFYNQTLLTCPTRWLVTPQVFIIGFVWLGTLLVLFVLFTVDVTKNKSFQILDMIGHLAAGILTIVSASCLIGFASELLDGDNCEQNPLAVIHSSQLAQNELTRRRAFDGNNSLRITVTINVAEEILKQCQKELTKMFQHWHILCGGIFAFITGVLHILVSIFAILASRDGKAKTNKNQTMGMGQGSMTPSEGQTQQADLSQTSSTPAAESPSQSPEK